MKRENLPVLKLIHPVFAVIWLFLIGYGLYRLRDYDETPGRVAASDVSWPVSSKIEQPRKPTLVLLVHPRCPCSRATLSELALLIAQCPNRLQVCVCFYRPANAPSGWEKTDLWYNAKGIPGVQVLCDIGGDEARRFHATTSGQALLYNAMGRLLFQGGITGARGHCGDNEGRTAIVSLIHTGTAARTQTPVFGCFLLGSPAQWMSKEKDGATGSSYGESF